VLYGLKETGYAVAVNGNNNPVIGSNRVRDVPGYKAAGINIQKVIGGKKVIGDNNVQICKYAYSHI
jgi:hypothetical protein